MILTARYNNVIFRNINARLLLVFISICCKQATKGVVLGHFDNSNGHIVPCFEKLVYPDVAGQRTYEVTLNVIKLCVYLQRYHMDIKYA